MQKNYTGFKEITGQWQLHHGNIAQGFGLK